MECKACGLTATCVSLYTFPNTRGYPSFFTEKSRSFYTLCSHCSEDMGYEECCYVILKKYEDASDGM